MRFATGILVIVISSSAALTQPKKDVDDYRFSGNEVESGMPSIGRCWPAWQVDRGGDSRWPLRWTNKPSLKRALNETAEADRRSVSAMVEILLEEALEQRRRSPGRAASPEFTRDMKAG
jgi:hypothetical protein